MAYSYAFLSRPVDPAEHAGKLLTRVQMNEDKSVLRRAIESDAPVDAIEKLLGEAEDIESVDRFGWTLLHSAIAFSREPRVAALLLGSGADIDARDILGRTALHVAVAEGLELLNEKTYSFEDFKLDERVDLLVGHGADVLQIDDAGRTPADLIVEHTVQSGETIVDELGRALNMLRHGMLFTRGFWFSNPSLESVKAAIDKGVSVNATDYYGMTPLHYAVQHFHNYETISYLLNGGADVMARDSQGNTPLHSVMYPFSRFFEPTYIPDPQYWHWKNPTIDLLIKSGASVSAKDNLGRTPLHHAVLCGSGKLGRVLMTLMSSGADIAARSNKGETPLHLAVRRDLSNIFLEMLINPTVINARDQQGQAPLHWAAIFSVERQGEDLHPHWNHVKGLARTSIEMLLDNGADIAARDNRGYTPLHLAASKQPILDQVRNIRSLLDYGADPAAITGDGQTAYEIAEQHGASEEILHLLRV